MDEYAVEPNPRESKAYNWSCLREVWLEQYQYMSDETKVLIGTAIKLLEPRDYDRPGEGGDSGRVYFDDGSEIYFDWDDGQFECNGRRLTYPGLNTLKEGEPLYWNYKDVTEFTESDPSYRSPWWLTDIWLQTDLRRG